jgi:hypothetical protein
MSLLQSQLVLAFAQAVTELVTVEKKNIVALTEIARDALRTEPQSAPSLAALITNRILQVGAGMKLLNRYLPFTRARLATLVSTCVHGRATRHLSLCVAKWLCRHRRHRSCLCCTCLTASRSWWGSPTRRSSCQHCPRRALTLGCALPAYLRTANRCSRVVLLLVVPLCVLPHVRAQPSCARPLIASFCVAALPLSQVYVTAWQQGGSGLHRPLDKLLGTWSGVFPNAVLSDIHGRIAALRAAQAAQQVQAAAAMNGYGGGAYGYGAMVPAPMATDPRLAPFQKQNAAAASYASYPAQQPSYYQQAPPQPALYHQQQQQPAAAPLQQHEQTLQQQQPPQVNVTDLLASLMDAGLLAGPNGHPGAAQMASGGSGLLSTPPYVAAGTAAPPYAAATTATPEREQPASTRFATERIKVQSQQGRKSLAGPLRAGCLPPSHHFLFVALARVPSKTLLPPFTIARTPARPQLYYFVCISWEGLPGELTTGIQRLSAARHRQTSTPPHKTSFVASVLRFSACHTRASGSQQPPVVALCAGQVLDHRQHRTHWPV